jgi:transportin-1
VRKLVCSGLVLMLSVQPEVLYEHLRELILFMLQSTQDPDPEVALESCEFWSAFCESQLPEEYA